MPANKYASCNFDEDKGKGALTAARGRFTGIITNEYRTHIKPVAVSAAGSGARISIINHKRPIPAQRTHRGFGIH
jgi:hypothetical protein